MTSVPELISARDAATQIGITPRALRYRIERGEIEATKLGTGRTSAYVITADEIERVKAGESA